VSAIVAIGERHRVEGFTLAGVRIVPVEDRAAARTAWQQLGAEVTMVLLTPRTREFLADLLPERLETIWTVIPD
jgi:vacuolar-type H+-ATPase subunit F/Vma7